jgi:Holin of 3TMs, for gene-transfer release
MFGIDDAISSVASLLSKAADKIWPDPEQRAKAQVAIMEAQARGDLDTLNASLSAILAEANSSDPWTSRARPTFLYVVYIMLLASIPMGIIYALSPSLASDLTAGFQAWLKAIPDTIIQLFGVVMLGYTAGRSWEKVKGVSK